MKITFEPAIFGNPWASRWVRKDSIVIGNIYQGKYNHLDNTCFWEFISSSKKFRCRGITLNQVKEQITQSYKEKEMKRKKDCKKHRCGLAITTTNALANKGYYTYTKEIIKELIQSKEIDYRWGKTGKLKGVGINLWEDMCKWCDIENPYPVDYDALSHAVQQRNETQFTQLQKDYKILQEENRKLESEKNKIMEEFVTRVNITKEQEVKSQKDTFDCIINRMKNRTRALKIERDMLQELCITSIVQKQSLSTVINEIFAIKEIKMVNNVPDDGRVKTVKQKCDTQMANEFIKEIDNG